jgi:hypothetical protein
MPLKIHATKIWIILTLLLCMSVVTACGSSDAAPTPPPGVNTWLLVKAPDQPLPVNKPINVRSRTEDGQAGVSHVELYALELPSGETNVLIRSDRAPFDQTTFTASQFFIPKQPGHYVVQVVGYNNKGETAHSNIISFDAR